MKRALVVAMFCGLLGFGLLRQEAGRGAAATTGNGRHCEGRRTFR